MEIDNWIHVIADAIVVSMAGYAISFLKKTLEKLSKDTEHAHDRLNQHDRAVSEITQKAFDSSAIVHGKQLFPILNKMHRRES